VQQFVRFGIDGGVQAVAFIIELEHGFVDYNLLRIASIVWL